MNNDLEIKTVEMNSKHENLFETLHSMVENPTLSVLDMQDFIISENLDRILFGHYDYCVNLSGHSSHSNPAVKPYDPTSQSDFEAAIGHLFTEQLLNRRETGELIGPEILMEAMETLNRNRKQEFYNILAIKDEAYSFYHLVKELQCNPNVVLIAGRELGWTNHSIQLNRDITCTIKTNYGYGSVSYFYNILSYKGVDIIPYSTWIKYFYAGKFDNITYTRSYPTDYESWEKCFNFIRDCIRNFNEDPDHFIQHWFIDEIETMMDGLHHFCEDEHHITVIKNENQCYEISNRRDLLLFKGEKISGALKFIEHIKTLENLNIPTEHYIDEILNLNTRIYPELENELIALKQERDKLNEQLASKDNAAIAGTSETKGQRSFLVLVTMNSRVTGLSRSIRKLESYCNTIRSYFDSIHREIA